MCFGLQCLVTSPIIRRVVHKCNCVRERLTWPLLARSSTDRLLSRQSARPKSHMQQVRSFFTSTLELFMSLWTMGTCWSNSSWGQNSTDFKNKHPQQQTTIKQMVTVERYNRQTELRLTMSSLGSNSFHSKLLIQQNTFRLCGCAASKSAAIEWFYVNMNQNI